MLSPHLIVLALGATWIGDHGPLAGAVDFSANIVPEKQLAIVQHTAGDLVAYVGTYRELHTTDQHSETTEILAMAGDSVTFDARGPLTARRYRHDRWPTAIVARR